MEAHEEAPARDGVAVRCRGVTKHYGEGAARVTALRGIDLDVLSGELMMMVGPSGCGKTTLGRSILRLVEPSSGSIIYNGKDITHVYHEELRQLRKKMQIIFQDP